MGNLVLERRIGESVFLSFGEVSVRVVIARAGQAVKLAIEAPLSVTVTRGEFLGVGADAAAAARVVTQCNKRGRA
jgi:carbon storage regulator CsrA